ncbi:MAG: cupredoxin domain-containing protein [Methanoculleus sp.]|nr:cupredoxin domain-containing protein [Methanoculleus sp.]
MRPNVILIVALLVVSAGILAAGCTSPGGNVTQPTAPPTGTETPAVTATTVAETPAVTGTTPPETPSTTATTATRTETPSVTETTAATTTTTTAVNATTEATTAAGGKAVTIGLTAHNIAFNVSTITVPAGAKVTVDFDNEDSGIPHNFAVYTNSAATEKIFVGDIITGPAKTTYTFTAPSKPGTYYFRCDVHPEQMNGNFIVQ